MNSRTDIDLQGADTSNSVRQRYEPHYASPLFYSDAHAKYLLGEGPRHFNIWILNSAFYRARYIHGGASLKKVPAEAHPSCARPVYRIVVRSKRPVSADAPVKVGEPA